MPVKDEHKKTLEQHSQGNKFIYSSYDNVTQEMVQEANVIIGNVDPFYLQEAKNLEWLQLNSAGADPYVKKGVLPEDVILTNATGAYGPSVAEHMLAVLFSLQKKLHLYRDNQNQCEWQDEGGIMSLCGGTLLIVGLGDIGLYFARLMKNFDYHIIGIKRRPGRYRKILMNSIPWMIWINCCPKQMLYYLYFQILKQHEISSIKIVLKK